MQDSTELIAKQKMAIVNAKTGKSMNFIMQLFILEKWIYGKWNRKTTCTESWTMAWNMFHIIRNRFTPYQTASHHDRRASCFEVRGHPNNFILAEKCSAVVWPFFFLGLDWETTAKLLHHGMCEAAFVVATFLSFARIESVFQSLQSCSTIHQIKNACNTSSFQYPIRPRSSMNQIQHHYYSGL